MSRVGKSPIPVPAGVTITVSEDNLVTVKGPKGELHQAVDKEMIVVNAQLSKNVTKHYMVYTVHC
jgi:large subunit ribosomal protein L6